MLSRSRFIFRNDIRIIIRNSSGTAGHGSKTSKESQQSATTNQVPVDVLGLSSACLEPATRPVGPGVDPKKNGAYKVPEYFCYNQMSFFEAEVEMSRFRCPQPSALEK